MSLLLLLRSSGPATQAGARSLLGFWMGGISTTPAGVTTSPWFFQFRVLHARRMN